jgi:anti-sigma regulatory factor (Ser/Thr protein kinase)
MCVSRSARFSGHITTPQRARDFCLDCLRELIPLDPPLPDAIDDYLLVTSELTANAVRAGATLIEVTVEIHRDHVRIAAADDAPGGPRPAVAVGPDEPHGRGLAIIAALARDWGVEYLGGRKQVWADLAIPIELEIQVECRL